MDQRSGSFALIHLQPGVCVSGRAQGVAAGAAEGEESSFITVSSLYSVHRRHGYSVVID